MPNEPGSEGCRLSQRGHGTIAGTTIDQHWATLDTTGRRAWLLAEQVKVLAYRPPIYGPVPQGAPPFTFTVESLMGKWTAPAD